LLTNKDEYMGHLLSFIEDLCVAGFLQKGRGERLREE